jgi:hypothetical protein
MSEMEPLTTGQLVPHFAIATVDGERRRYADLWQKRLLALVLLPEAESDASRAYQGSLSAIEPQLTDDNVTLIVSTEAIAGLRPPGWLVADQFGEIHHVQQARDPRDVVLPAPDELLSWVRYLRSRCG